MEPENKKKKKVIINEDNNQQKYIDEDEDSNTQPADTFDDGNQPDTIINNDNDKTKQNTNNNQSRNVIEILDDKIKILNPNLLKDKNARIRCVSLHLNIETNQIDSSYPRKIYINFQDLIKFLDYDNGLGYAKRNKYKLIPMKYDKVSKRLMISADDVKEFLKKIKYFQSVDNNKLEKLESIDISESVLTNRPEDEDERKDKIVTKKIKTETHSNSEKSKKTSESNETVLKLINSQWRYLPQEKKDKITKKFIDILNDD
jgi:hypothetical protein